MKKKAPNKYYENKELFMKLSFQFNMSLGCFGGFENCVSLEVL